MGSNFSVLVVLFVFSILTKRLAGKDVPEMTYAVFSQTLTNIPGMPR